MGVLKDNAGVLGGIGMALSQLGADKRAERLQGLQYEREMALKKMEQEHQSSENKLSRDANVSEGAKNRQVDVGKLGLERDKLDADVSEGAKTRASNEKIAGVRAAATRDAAGARSGAKGRWITNKTANSSTTKDGISTTEDIVLTDRDSGRTFKQVNNMFIPQGGQPPAKRASARHVSMLIANPGAADEFLKTYGYLPIEFYQSTQAPASEPAIDEEE